MLFVLFIQQLAEIIELSFRKFDVFSVETKSLLFPVSLFYRKRSEIWRDTSTLICTLVIFNCELLWASFYLLGTKCCTWPLEVFFSSATLYSIRRDLPLCSVFSLVSNLAKYFSNAQNINLLYVLWEVKQMSN